MPTIEVLVSHRAAFGERRRMKLKSLVKEGVEKRLFDASLLDHALLGGDDKKNKK